MISFAIWKVFWQIISINDYIFYEISEANTSNMSITFSVVTSTDPTIIMSEINQESHDQVSTCCRGKLCQNDSYSIYGGEYCKHAGEMIGSWKTISLTSRLLQLPVSIDILRSSTSIWKCTFLSLVENTLREFTWKKCVF